MRISLSFLLLIFSLNVVADDSAFATTYDELVDDQGNISLPKDFRTKWVFLGAWSVANKKVEDNKESAKPGAEALHNVYTQPGVVEYYREHGKFPDGAVLMKELFKGETAEMTTGTVSRGSEVQGWFIMIKDTKGRFTSNPLWGDGWGWALFNSDQPNKTVTKSYKAECTACHIPAKNDDWVYLSGYPLLNTGN